MRVSLRVIAKQTLLCILSVFPSLLMIAQGIQWTTDLSWEQVKQKAKTENKYIFIDVYATWCAPCKMMDREIYPLTKIGDLYNEKFICLRVQHDQTGKDNEQVKRWYNDAKKFCDEFKVYSFPTFLFFSPDGKLVHRVSGGLDATNLLAVANDALLGNGYSSSIDEFKKGEYERLNLKELAMSAKYAGDDSISKAIAAIFIKRIDVHELIKQDNMVFVTSIAEGDKQWALENCMPKISMLTIAELANPEAIRFLLYASKNDELVQQATNFWISTMSEHEIYKKDTLEYIKTFMRTSRDKSFDILTNNAKRIDRIMRKRNWSRWDTDNIIIKEEFYDPIFKPVSILIREGKQPSLFPKPDWNGLFSSIAAKYGEDCANRFLYSPKVSWYKLTGNIGAYIKNLVAEMNRTNGWDLHTLVLNNNAMEVFRYSVSEQDLLTTAKWMKMYFKKNPKAFEVDASAIDTYALLLYKAGQVKKGVQLEEKAFIVNPKDPEIASNLAKMKEGLPIWPKGYDVIK